MTRTGNALLKQNINCTGLFPSHVSDNEKVKVRKEFSRVKNIVSENKKLC